MKIIRLEAVLPIDAKEYMAFLHTPAYFAFQARALNFNKKELIESWQRNGFTYLKVLTEPSTEEWVPGILQKHLKAKNNNKAPLQFIDIIEVNPELNQAPPYVLHVRGKVPVLGDKVKIKYRNVIHDEGPDQTRHVLEGKIDVKIFGIGSIIQRIIVSSMEKTYQELPSIIEKWQRFKAEMAGHPGGLKRLLSGQPDVENVDWISEDLKAKLKESPQIEAKPKKSFFRLGSGAKKGLSPDNYTLPSPFFFDAEGQKQALYDREGQVKSEIYEPRKTTSTTEKPSGKDNKARAVRFQEPMPSSSPTPPAVTLTKVDTPYSTALQELPSLDLDLDHISEEEHQQQQQQLQHEHVALETQDEKAGVDELQRSKSAVDAEPKLNSRGASYEESKTLQPSLVSYPLSLPPPTEGEPALFNKDEDKQKLARPTSGGVIEKPKTQKASKSEIEPSLESDLMNESSPFAVASERWAVFNEDEAAWTEYFDKLQVAPCSQGPAVSPNLQRLVSFARAVHLVRPPVSVTKISSSKASPGKGVNEASLIQEERRKRERKEGRLSRLMARLKIQ